ncbi:voltage-gated potassium channel [Fistulina hepatica ATCC 64428]|uniref:Voltage-gated potassium channel n=1 Tax=Fistulina hepatica ATCC 64428 TaxID=1128425 RepID=A0A0D7A5K9_9AGAR|nr:voltage-gated potassium channel [Fistulina hepatica ATCC 64428]
MSTSIELTRIPQPLDSPRFLTEDRLPPQLDDVNDVDIFPHDQSADEEVFTSIQEPWRRELYALLELPTSSSAAFVLHIFITFLIVFSALVTVLETIPAFHLISNRVWFGLETSLVALFTVEYIGRCVARPTWISLFKWIFSFFGIIDLLAVMPYYIELLMKQDTAVLFRFSILRMFRLLRVFKPFRYAGTVVLTIEVMYLSVRRSQHALLALSFFVVMVLTIFSTLLYFAERGIWDPSLEMFVNADGDPSQFSSIPAAAWFVIVTITTVGYGEITPRSTLGRLITLPLLVFGLLLIALPSFVLGREFSIVWKHMTREQSDELFSDSPTRPLFSSGIQSARDSTGIPRDLSNFKLAQNQTHLSQQIAELRTMVEQQNQTIQRLVNVVQRTTDVEGSASGADVAGGIDVAQHMPAKGKSKAHDE